MSLPLEPPFYLPPHPTLLGCYRAWFELPESNSRFPLAIYFTHGNVHVSMLLPPYIPPSSPRPVRHAQKSILYVCISIAALQIGSSVLSF